MKVCPVCQTTYDEEIIKFCTKDGTPLVEENPTFTAMPSESFTNDEDADEETVIRRNNPPIEAPAASSSQRIVIPTGEVREPVRAKAQPASQPPPKKSNTALIVLATILGTFVVLGALGGIWYVLRGGSNLTNSNENKANANFNALPSPSFNTNTLPVNLNTNINANTNVSINANANLKTPTPTPTRTPTPTPTTTPTNSNASGNQNTNVNLGNTNVISRPTPTPSPQTTPTATQNVNVGLMNSRATSLTTPAYPQTARQINASGEVRVQISVDEQGNVTTAKAISGHPLLRPSAEAAARQSRFNPVRVGDRNVNATGYLVYNFINQ